MKFAGFDVETWQPDEDCADRALICWSFVAGRKVSFTAHRGVHPEAEVWYQKGREDEVGDSFTLAAQCKYFWDEGYTFAGHSLFYELVHLPPGTPLWGHAVFSQGQSPPPPYFCTLVAGALLDETGKNSLEALSRRYLGVGKVEGVDRRRLMEAPLTDVRKYNIQDSKLAARLARALAPRVKAAGLWDLYQERMKLLGCLSEAHVKGLRLDQKALGALWVENGLVLKSVSQYFSDRGVNPKSAPQVVDCLKDDPDLGKTAKGAPSANAAALERIRRTGGPNAEFAGKLLDFRAATKLQGTYLEPLSGKWLHGDGKVRTFFHLGKGQDHGRQGQGKSWGGGTVTGRLSSSRPNLQNVPPQVARLFRPDPHYLLFEADYSQAELRVAAWLSGDEGMQAAFKAGQDFHTATVASLFQVPYDQAVSLVESDPAWKERRAIAKTINFCTLYGGGVYRVLESLAQDGVEVPEATVKQVHRDWCRTNWQFMQWARAVQGLAQEEGVVVTPLGVVRHLGTWSQMSTAEKARAARQAVNALVQNMAAELTYAAILELWDFGFDIRLTVHDSILGCHLRREHGGARYSEVRELLEAALERLAPVRLARLFQGDSYRIEDLSVKADVSTGLRRWKGGS